MRLSWYSDTGVAVFSIWQGGRCSGTFRLPVDDLARMVATLRRGPDGGRPERDQPAGRAPDDAATGYLAGPTSGSYEADFPADYPPAGRPDAERLPDLPAAAEPPRPPSRGHGASSPAPDYGAAAPGFPPAGDRHGGGDAAGFPAPVSGYDTGVPDIHPDDPLGLGYQGSTAASRPGGYSPSGEHPEYGDRRPERSAHPEPGSYPETGRYPEPGGYPEPGFPEPGGYPDRGYPDRDYPDRDYPDRDYPDRDYAERDYPERGAYPEHGGAYPETVGYPERGDYAEPGGYPEPADYAEPDAYPEPGRRRRRDSYPGPGAPYGPADAGRTDPGAAAAEPPEYRPGHGPDYRRADTRDYLTRDDRDYPPGGIAAPAADDPSADRYRSRRGSDSAAHSHPRGWPDDLPDTDGAEYRPAPLGPRGDPRLATEFPSRNLSAQPRSQPPAGPGDAATALRPDDGDSAQETEPGVGFAGQRQVPTTQIGDGELDSRLAPSPGRAARHAR